MASIAAFVYFWSSAYEVSGCCTTDTLYPSFLRMLATASQPEPSAKAPCTRTTFLICCVMTILLCSKDPLGPFDFDAFLKYHPEVKYSWATPFTSLCRSILRWPSRVLVPCLDRGMARSFRCAGCWRLGGVRRLRLISLRVGNDDFATTKKTRI